MSMIKRVTLTINKNNNSVKLSCPLNFYKNDTLTLYFEVEKYNFNINNDTGYEKIIPLSAIAYVETPEGIDSIQTAIIDDNLIMVNLSQYHTSFIGTSRMQLVIRDKDGCQCATPCFTFSVDDLINDYEIITDEDGNIITSENDIPIVHGHGNGYNAISDLDEIEDLDNAYMLITKDEKSYKARTSLFGAANLEDYARLEDIPTFVSQLENDLGYLTEHQDVSNLVTREELSINYASKLLVANEISDLDDKIDLLEYNTRNELETKANNNHNHDEVYAPYSHTHSYDNLTDVPVLPNFDNFTTKEELLDFKNKTETDLSAKSDTTHTHDDRYATINHQHSYNELLDKPVIPSMDGLATKDYVNSELSTNLYFYALKTDVPTSLPANGGNANTINGYSIWVGTQEEYNALEVKSDTVIYFIKG